jgi:hypothetical protein
MSGRGRRGGLKSRGGGGALTLDQRFTMMATNTQAMRQNMVNARCVFSLPHANMPGVISPSLILNVSHSPRRFGAVPNQQQKAVRGRAQMVRGGMARGGGAARGGRGGARGGGVTMRGGRGGRGGKATIAGRGG